MQTYRTLRNKKQDVDEFAYASADDATYDKRKCGLSSIPTDVSCESSGRCSQSKSAPEYSNHEVSAPVQGKSIEPLDADWKKTKWTSEDCFSPSLQSGNGTFPSVEKEHMFDKVVTPSDVGKLNRLVIPQQHAEKYFPLDHSSSEKGLLLNFEDRNGKAWRFRYSYWNSSRSYVMTKGWSRFVKEKKLDAGDIISFQRGIGEEAKHRLYIDWRRRISLFGATVGYYSASHGTEENASKALNASTFNMEIEEPQHGSTVTPLRTQPEIKIPEINAGNYGFSTPGQTCTKLETAIENGMVTISKRRNDKDIEPVLNTIMESIGNPEIGTIGIHGRAGVGKTVLVEALKDHPVLRDMFECIIWVTVPKIWSLKDVQLEISRQLPSNEIEDAEHINSSRLFALLESIKFLLILDDVGEYIDLKMVGIPDLTCENGSKILLTTRSELICHEMAVDLKIILEDLLSWELFCRHVGEVVDSSTIQPLARQVVELCCHYSHPIILMASALKDLSDVCMWNNAVETLSKQSAPDHEEKLDNLMFNVLSFSYDRLQDDTTRKCLKSCALLSGNRGIEIESLMQSWIKDFLIDGYDKGSAILETLIGANLLESLEGHQFVKLQETVQRILIDQIILPEECQSFLMHSGMKLTEPPEVGEWERSKVINLMDNELSFLPKNLRCTTLQALFLQRNCKLRVIPSSFFDYMPALQVLNLSRTRIKSLPESLFKLISLKRLFLNHCDLLMTLPPRIGELKHLEVLDLDGTKIMNLPQEVGLLANLTCLEVSFLKPMNDTSELPNYVIPHGVISALCQLDELNLDVSPEDQWWNGCAEAVISEFCGLTTLKTLKFYFPRVELLSHLKWNSIQMVSPSLSQFSFIVGHHVNRIMCRLPLDVEFELQQYDRCLKYVNGKGIPEDIQNVLRHATAFSLDRHKTVKKLSDFGLGNMVQLKCCVVGECNELQAIIDGHQVLNESYSDGIAYIPVIEYLYIHYMKNLRCIWEGPLHNSGFFYLKSLTLHGCPELTIVFTPGLLASLSNLKELTVDDCPRVISLISSNNSEQVTDYFLPNLRRISLHYLPDLASISNGFSISPMLEWMSIYYCPNLKSLPISKAVHGNLRKIKGEVSWWTMLKWESSQQHSWDDVFVEIELCD